MQKMRSIGGAIVAVAAATIITGCSTDSGNSATPSHSVATPSATSPSTPQATSSAASSPTTTTSADVNDQPPAQPSRLTPAGVVCDMIANPNTNSTRPVVVLEGEVNCDEAMAVASRYLDGIKSGDTQGQGAFLTVEGWECSWPYVEGRSHADSYLKCVDPTGSNAIRIGD